MFPKFFGRSNKVTSAKVIYATPVGNFKPRIFYAGWRGDSACHMGYVHLDTIKPTVVNGTVKGKYDTVIDGEVVTLEEIVLDELLRQRDGENDEDAQWEDISDSDN